MGLYLDSNPNLSLVPGERTGFAVLLFLSMLCLLSFYLVLHASPMAFLFRFLFYCYPAPILNWAFELQNFVCCALPCCASIFNVPLLPLLFLFLSLFLSLF